MKEAELHQLSADAVTLVTIACEGASFSILVPSTQGSAAIGHAIRMQHALPEIELFALLRGNICRLHAEIEQERLAGGARYSQNEEHLKLIIGMFALGLLCNREDIAAQVVDSLVHGDAVINVRLTGPDVNVRITKGGADFVTEFEPTERSLSRDARVFH